MELIALLVLTLGIVIGYNLKRLKDKLKGE